MAIPRWLVPVASLGLFAFALALAPGRALAHCDTLDGPVVKAAQAALDKGDANLALVWVQKADEPEILAAFEHARAVRILGAEAKRLADRYFFETLVRVHRGGEGAPYTGLKPAGSNHDPAIAAADRALEIGRADALVQQVTAAAAAGLRDRFAAVLAAKGYRAVDVAAGREYVGCYVEFIHYVERLHAAATSPVTGHFLEGELGAANEERH
jgi:uncharacterized protein DUF6448